MIHWCQNETDAVLMAIPFIGLYLARIKVWLHRVFHRCPKELNNGL
jgi:hypothetical protein